jgi:ACS family glucarate transporter-like MFS transporter
MSSGQENGTVVVQNSKSGAGELGSMKSFALGPKRTRFRWTLAIFALLMTFMSYIDRVNLAVTAPAIINELHFTKVHIGILQTVFFVCYALCQIPSGTLTEFFGHRKIVPFSLAWWSVFTSLTATCRQFPSWVIVRGLFGVGEAPLYPGLNAAFSNWFPKRERGMAVAFMSSGSKFGPAVGIPVAAVIMATWGWRWVFVIFGAVGLVLAAVYYLLLRTHPRESRFVNEAELAYIADGQTVAAGPKKTVAPWGKFLRSTQFWAVGGQFAVADYIQYVFMAWLPVYLMEAHHFSLKQMGFGAAIPELGFAFGNIFCGLVCDYLIAKGLLDAKSRAWFGGVGLVLCGLGLCLTAMSLTKWVTVGWLTFALFSLGATLNASWSSCIDLGGKYTGTVTGWMNFWGNIIGAAAPTTTAWIAIRYGWRSAILATASTAVIGAIVWIFVKPEIPLPQESLEPAPSGVRS